MTDEKPSMRLDDEAMTTTPRFQDCLAGEVLSNAPDWLGDSSPIGLGCLLNGASTRAWLLEPSLKKWRIYGPLHQPDFTARLFNEIGNAKGPIGWETALELHFRSPTDALAYLEKLCREYFDAGKIDAEHGCMPEGCTLSEQEFWPRFLDRPALCAGSFCGTWPWHIYLFLEGMSRGGDWLGLPKMVFLDRVIDKLKSESRKQWRTDFGIYRIMPTENIISMIEGVYSKLKSRN